MVTSKDIKNNRKTSKSGRPIPPDLDGSSKQISDPATMDKKRKPTKRKVIAVAVSQIQGEDQEYLIEGVLPLGAMACIQARADRGKSTFLLGIAAAVSKGGVLPLTAGNTTIGSCIIFAAEDNVNTTLRPRLEAAGANLDNVYIIDEITDTNGSKQKFTFAKHAGLLDEYIQSINDDPDKPNVLFVGIDPIMSMLMGVNSDNNAEIRELLGQLQGIAAKYYLSIAYLNHEKKGHESNPLHQSHGSTAFTDFPRSVLAIFKSYKDEGRYLAFQLKNNLAVEHGKFAFFIDSVEVTVTNIGTGKTKTTTRGVIRIDTEPVEETLEQARANEAGGEKVTKENPLQSAMAWVAKTLTERKTITRKEVVALGMTAGHTEKKIGDAKKFLPIKVDDGKYKMSDTWTWEGYDDPEETGK